ncbi:MAG: CRISPR system precrRNA processing endoribonuclease RAMP protein Cas6, partial [Endomicrobium sp.]|nr:CRISPR system precrRNA processing endoribonuclease RAMP protein Cas6 [Endomicrobium sp.]
TCAYKYVFETTDANDIPRPYVFETEFADKRNYKKDAVFKFNLLLFGKAMEFAPHFIFSFIELGKIGFTNKKYKFALEKAIDNIGNVVFDGKEILKKADIICAKDLIDDAKAKESINKIEIEFITPFRLEVSGKLIKKPNFMDIIKVLTRRISAISKYHCGGIEQVNHLELINKANDIEMESHLGWFDWTRYSARQKTKMELGGLLGNIVLKGGLDVFMPYLLLGSFIHIGKNCTFGLGKYRILF